MKRDPQTRPIQALLRGAALCSTLVGLIACGEGGEPPGQVTPDGGSTYTPAPVTLGAPINASADTWSWIDFPDSVCDEGTPTGIAINPVANSKNLLVFLTGGGACWERTTCVQVSTASKGPFTKVQFEQLKGMVGGSILDRNLAGTPFKDYSLVFIPYCTGDVHAGDSRNDYGTAGMPQYYNHRGYRNVEAFLKRLGATFPELDRLVVSGSSAGGFGSAFNYDQFRRYFPKAKKSYLLDDSGPPLIGDAIQSFERESWYKAWNLNTTVGDRCPGCPEDFSQMIPELRRRYPNDRFALLSTTQDQTIRGFFLMNAMTFEAALLDLAVKVIDPLPNFKYYFVAGQSHTFMLNPNKNNAPNQPLLGWLTQFVNDDAGWRSVKP